MSSWNQLLKALDQVLGFPNMIGSTVKKTNQFYDPKSNQHIVTLEYKVKVRPGLEQTRSTRLLDSILNLDV